MSDSPGTKRDKYGVIWYDAEYFTPPGTLTWITMRAKDGFEISGAAMDCTRQALSCYEWCYRTKTGEPEMHDE